MRNLHPDQVAGPQDALLREARDGLVAKQRAAKKGKGKASTEPEVAFDFNLTGTLALVTDTLTADRTTYASSGPRVASTVLALEVLELVLVESRSWFSSLDEASATALSNHVFSTAVLLQLVNIIWALWDTGVAALLQKCRAANTALLALSSTLQSTVVPQHLLSQLSVAPWLNKRSISVFDSLLPHYTVQELARLSVSVKDPPSIGVLKRITEGMAEADEIALLSGRIALKWLVKAGLESEVWQGAVLDAVRGTERARNNICLYFLPGLFQARQTAFTELVKAGRLLEEGPKSEVDYLAVLAVLKVGNAAGLLNLDPDAPPTVPSNSNSASKVQVKAAGSVVDLSSSLVETCLLHASPSLRCSALSLLVVSPQVSSDLPTSSFRHLRTFYTYSMGDEDGEFRMASTSLTGRLLVRLRDSAWKAYRRDANSVYVAEIKSFVEWWSSLLFASLNPARPFRTRINALRLLDLLFQAHLDPAFSSTAPSAFVGYSSYRRTAPTPAPQFQAKHGRSPESAGWPFDVPLVTPKTTFVLLRLLLSTYTSLRNLAVTLLERFPSPLPGYADNDARVKEDLLGPALKMIKSGREAETSAGAGIFGLVWRKWVYEGGAEWDLREVLALDTTTLSEQVQGPFSFLHGLMDLAESQVAAHVSDLGRAASTNPMHGTLLAIRHLFVSIPSSSLAELGSPEDRHAVFHRALALVEAVWQATSAVLAASAPEGMGAVDTEEARAMLIEPGDDAAAGEADDGGSGGPMHKIVLSATWRAMKEAGELLETILRIPSELGAPGFQAIWTQSDVEHIGALFADWLARIRHRGAFMAMHPCYSRACAALLLCQDWPEVQKLPLLWLDMHLDSIVSKKISITRRSAGIPYCILGILTAVLPTNPAAFTSAFTRLFEIAESKEDSISDESRVHAMNTLRTTFLDAAAARAVAPFVERGFLISISMFWSSNWICRNVAMMQFGALVTRAFTARRTNLSRDSEALKLRVTIADFFGRYPSLHPVFLSELELSTRDHLNDLPSSNLHSSLFSVLMLLSLLQSPNKVEDVEETYSNPFIPLVLGCSKSRVWKIRDVAGDALTGLVTPNEVPAFCLDLLTFAPSSTQNELHGRLVQVYRLLEARDKALAVDLQSVSEKLSEQLPALLSERVSFAVRTTVFDIARILAAHHEVQSSAVLEAAHAALSIASRWPAGVKHLPSAENFVEAAFRLALAYDPDSALIAAALASPFLEVRRQALLRLEETGEVQSSQIRTALFALVLTDGDAADVRVSAAELLATAGTTSETARDDLNKVLLKQYQDSLVVPFREAVLPLLASLPQSSTSSCDIARLIGLAADVDQSVESREAAATALRNLRLGRDEISPTLARTLLQLVQDDDPTVRAFAGDAFAKAWNEGQPTTDRRMVQQIVTTSGHVADYRAELELDAVRIESPSSLLFAVERSNIFVDDILESDCMTPNSPSLSRDDLDALLQRLSKALGGRRETGPLGRLGNDLVCKWGIRLVKHNDRLAQAEGHGAVIESELIEWLRSSM